MESYFQLSDLVIPINNEPSLNLYLRLISVHFWACSFLKLYIDVVSSVFSQLLEERLFT